MLMGQISVVAILAAALFGSHGPGVIVLQQGVAPAADYAGCRDTWISGEQWERGHNYGRRETLTTGGKRHILIRFDLAPVPKGVRVRKAVLRIADAGYPRRGRDGRFASNLRLYVLTRPWKDDANWLEHTRTNYKQKDEGDWKTPGGEYDTTTDFGQGAPGLVAKDTIFDGPWGHVHEFDVTPVVRAWLAGRVANHGLLIRSVGRGRIKLASSEWPVSKYRPQLIIDCGTGPGGIKPLTSVPARIELDPIASTPDPGKPAKEYFVVRVGLNANCHPHGASTDAYIKENVGQFPGTWGWMTQCRVGGVAGAFDRTLLYFDLTDLPAKVSVRSAKLVCTLVERTSRQIRSYRYGVFLLRLPESPGWSPQEVTAAVRAKGKPWPPGGLLAVSGPRPISIGKVIQKEIEVRGRKRRIDWGIEFDVTGAVRAWLSGKVPNCGLVLDNRIEGGQYDIYGSRSWYPQRRPYLEIEIAHGVAARPGPPVKPIPAPPPGDYWVEPMRKVHARFRGSPGTLAQYGDSITVTMAYLAPFGWSRRIRVRNADAETQKDIRTVEQYAKLGLWVKWKGGQWGNTGMMKSDWLFRNIDTWQKKMNPEAAVIMFGTNDIGNIVPPQYTEYMAAALRRMMADGTVPMLTSIPPAAKGFHRPYWLAALSIAHGLKVPLIDYYAEILRRRPDDWNGRLKKFLGPGGKNLGYGVPTLISGDGIHPSNPKKWQHDWSDDGLNHNGFTLRNYMTIRMYAQVVRKVFQAGK